MTRAMTRVTAILLVVVLSSLAWPALAENGLAGVRIGDSPSMVRDQYGGPQVIATPGGKLFLGSAKGPKGEAPSLWSRAVEIQGLRAGQAEWIYLKGNLIMGFLITGEGPDAVVTDVLATSFSNVPVESIRTEKEVTIGSSFAHVLTSYGYPPATQIFLDQEQIWRQGPTRGVLPVLGPAPGFGGPGFLTAPSGSPRFVPGGVQETPMQYTPSIPMRRIPPGAPGQAQGQGAGMKTVRPTTATVLGVSQQFTRSCILFYPGVDFVLRDLRVVRIHIY